MKYFFSFLMLWGLSTATWGKDLKQGLYNINSCWKDHQDVNITALNAPKTDREWIKLHLSLVEQTLRNTKTTLTARQQANRTQALDMLHQYWNQGNFPINEDYTYRTPIFIDNHNNFCAVGYLVKATGHEAVSRKISHETNLAYVKEMKYPELNAWAAEYGFTVDELAWIQPSYGPPPTRHCDPMGKGTNGDIYEMYVGANDKLYIGGTFTMADSTVAVNNVAYITEAGGTYTYHDIGGGVNGVVNAIIEFDGNLWVGGKFTEAGGIPVTNIAYWDGSNWHAAGCTYGTINDLEVFNGELYAAGDFDVCAAMTEVNFAKWDPTFNIWVQQTSSGLLEGHVNTIEIDGTSLLLGGDFTHIGTPYNVIRWDASVGYTHFSAPVSNEVKDITMHDGKIYLACKRTSASDSDLVVYYDNGSWQPTVQWVYGSNASFNTFCTQGDTLMSGGSFEIYQMMINAPYINCMPIAGTSNTEWFTTDGSIEKMIVFKNDLIAAGKFTGSYNYQTWDSITVNHIAKKGFPDITSVPTPGGPARQIKLYPNPASTNSVFVVENNMNANRMYMTDITGRKIMDLPVSKDKETFNMPNVTPGYYNITLMNASGDKETKKLLVD